MNLLELRQKLNWPKYRYVLVTILVSLLAFARNLLFMKTLGLAALGQIALLQTLVIVVGFVQVGLINGAYIAYAARDRVVNRRIVEVMATGVLALVPVAAVVVLAGHTTGIGSKLIWPETLAIGLATGIATLASTWMNNALVADGHLGLSNLINLGAVLLSLLVAFFSRDQGLTVALLSLLLQPLAVALAAMAIDPNLRPRRIGLHGETLALLFRLGLAPFLGGLAVLAMNLVERWSIAAVLGPEALGQFYIVLMYATFFGLIPAALLNVFFPQAKRAYASHETALLMDYVRRHLLDLKAYFLLTVALTVLLLPGAVARFLPKFADSAGLIYYALPGLFLFTVRDSASLVLFSSGRMRPLFIAGAMTLGLFCLGVLSLWFAGRLSLTSVLVARAVATLPGTVLLLVAQRRQIDEMAHG